jgi:hypothetical protein
MSNKKVTKNSCNFCIPAASLSDFSLNPRDKMVEAHAADHDKIVIKGSYGFLVKIGDDYFVLDEDVTLSTATDLDTGAIANGKDYYVYACNDGGTLDWKESLASTYPAGFNANTSRKMAGFHTLCANVGTIAGHTLTGYIANDILPASIWDLRHRAINGNNEGLVYDSKIHKWAMIYLASGTGVDTTSAYLGTISDTRNWMDFVDDGHAIGMRLPTDHEFQSLAYNSNEETNILGSADPGTTGGHSDTASRRMISDIGCEDCAGVMYQWLLDQSWRLDGAGIGITAASKTATVTDSDTPGGNIIYLKFDNGEQYLCCNMANAAADKVVAFGTDYKVTVKHDANAAVGGLAVTFDDDGTQPDRIIVNNTTLLKDCYIETNNPLYSLKLKHAASGGVNLYYDDTADDRLECTCAGNANADIDLALISFTNPSWGWYNLPAPGRGSLYKQGSHGDVKLLAGGTWSDGAVCGSRGRNAYYYRWLTNSHIGARFLAAPLLGI